MPATGRSARTSAGEPAWSRRQWLTTAVFIECAAGLLYAGSQSAPPKSVIGANSPPLDVPTIDGKVVAVHKQPGKVVLVDVMTTSCPSCKQASAAIQTLYQEFGEKGFLPVAVAIDPQAPSMLPFYRNLYSLTFPVGIVAREEVLRYLDHPPDKPLYVPTLVLLDRRGRIAMKQVGWPGEQELRSAVTRLIDRKT